MSYKGYGSGKRTAGFGYGSSRRTYDDYDYGYGGSYKSSKSWSWGNWGGWGSYSEDDDKDLYIKAHENYFTPKNADIEAKIDWKNNNKTNRDLIKEMSRYFYYRMIDETNYFEEKYTSGTGAITEQEQAAFEAKKSFYEDMWEKFIPGVTPLEKSLNVFRELMEQKQKSGDSSDEVDPTKDYQSVQFNEEVYTDMEYNELLDANKFGKKHKFSIMNKISLIRELGSQFKVEKEIDEKIVANSKLIAKKMMRDYSQLANIDLYQKLLPTFPIKMLTKDLIVNVPIDKTEHKQKIIILLDFSGSMNDTTKQEWVIALLTDRLRYVLKEEAEVFFSYFVSDIDELSFTHLHDRDSVMKFWQKFSTSPTGGTTYLGKMVKYLGDQISQKKLHNLKIDLSEEKPEILAIADGQDDAQSTGFSYKTNAVSIIDGPNTDLEKLCVANKGKYVHIGYDIVKTTSEEGKQEIKLK